VKTQLERLAEWVVALRLEDVPREVQQLAALQVLDTLAAICAGARSPAGRRVRAALSRQCPNGPCRVLPDGAGWGVLEAVYLHSALANALELDNFVLSGHLGQSAVTTALALGAMVGADGEQALVAQVAGVEAATRLGAYLTTGPQQGHMRAYVHRVAAAVTAARLIGLDAPATARALAIALSTPEFPLYPAAFSADTKVVLTSGPATSGILAARLSEAGLDAALDVVEHPLGLLTYFSYLKHTPDVWGAMGRTWFLYSLSSKSHATCAYAQAPVTAALGLRARCGVTPAEIESVVVHAPMTTVVMEAFSRPHLRAGLTPVNMHFSTRRSVAAALLHGALDGAYFADEAAFAAREGEIAALAERVELRHEWSMTVELLRGIDAGLEGGGRPGILGMGQARASLDRFREAFGSRPLLSVRDLPDLLRTPAADLGYLTRRYWRAYRWHLPFRGGAAARAAWRACEHDFRRLRLALAGRVTLRLRGGRELVEECRVPPGFAGDPDRERVIRAKFEREAAPVLGQARADRLASAVLAMPAASPGELMEAIA
jgi:2-methylcitrate dehydratase PrpD